MRFGGNLVRGGNRKGRGRMEKNLAWVSPRLYCYLWSRWAPPFSKIFYHLLSIHLDKTGSVSFYILAS